MRKQVIVVALGLLLAGCETRPMPDQIDGRLGDREPPVSSHAPASHAPSGTAPAMAQEAYMDRQEGMLRQELRGTGVLVSRRGDDLAINLRADALFAPNSVSLTSQAQDLLRAVADVLRYYDRSVVEVDGYTDTTGAPDRNLIVSQRRADAVGSALKAGGVASRRVFTRGFGETRLKIPTGDNANEPRNRRVEIHISPAKTA